MAIANLEVTLFILHCLQCFHLSFFIKATVESHPVREGGPCKAFFIWVSMSEFGMSNILILHFDPRWR